MFTENFQKWCRNDLVNYCPLVYSYIATVALLSLLIVLYCLVVTRSRINQIRTSIRQHGTYSSAQTEQSSNLEILSRLREPFSISSQSSSVFSISNYNDMSTPPSYEESQNMELNVAQSSANRDTSFECINEQNEILFPSYRCVFLTKNKATGITLLHLTRQPNFNESTI